MLNILWLLLIILSVIFGAMNGRIPEVVAAVTDSAKLAVEVALGLAGIMVLWLGIMQVAEDAGLIRLFAKLLRPIMVRLFPDVPAEHPAMGSMLLNIAANMLGVGNAATPLGLRAMHDLEQLNKVPGTATNAMCTFLAINTSGVQLIPATAIAYLAAAGATNPTDIVLTTLIATTCSTITAIIAVKSFQRFPIFAISNKESS